MPQHKLREKIKEKEFQLAVLGLGYVGLPLACEFAESGIQVLGIDIDESKVKSIASQRSYIKDISDERLASCIQSGYFTASTDMRRLSEVDVISICVPTPLRKSRNPDLQYILEAVNSIRDSLRPGQLIVLESTTYPGTTEEVMLPILEESGLAVGRDFFLAFSPERVDPGNREFDTKNTPKVVGGVSAACTELASAAYSYAIDSVVAVSSTKSAEMVKLYENTFRAVNIGMANEMVMMCNTLGVDVWEVIDAAATKPFGFMPFYPGPGLGGHCIPIDPQYLAWKLKSLDYDARFISLADEVNRSMPFQVLDLLKSALSTQEKSLSGAMILVLGVSYKSNINDVRESPATEIMQYLDSEGACLSYHDALNPTFKLRDTSLQSQPLTEDILSAADCVLILSPHSYFDKELILAHSSLIVDTRNFCQGKQVFRLGAPYPAQD